MIPLLYHDFTANDHNILIEVYFFIFPIYSACRRISLDNQYNSTFHFLSKVVIVQVQVAKVNEWLSPIKAGKYSDDDWYSRHDLYKMLCLIVSRIIHAHIQ